MRIVGVLILMFFLSASPVGTGEPEEPSPEEFRPSQQVRVDNEISFPVDI